MAYENFVMLTGMIISELQTENEHGLTKGTIKIMTKRKDIDTIAGSNKNDEIPIVTKSSSMIKQMRPLKEGTLVSVIGIFCSVDVTKEFQCNNPACDKYLEPIPYKGVMSYIHPIELMPFTGIEPDPKMTLYNYREHSNTAHIIGKICSEVRFAPIERPNRQDTIDSWKMRLSVKRPVLVTNSLSTCDYISVHSFSEIPGDIGPEDMVAVNGFVRSKKFVQKRQCPCCKSSIETNDYALSIVPYRVEYFRKDKNNESSRSVKNDI